MYDWQNKLTVNGPKKQKKRGNPPKKTTTITKNPHTQFNQKINILFL